jgi:hypothetical protein
MEQVQGDKGCVREVARALAKMAPARDVVLVPVRVGSVLAPSVVKRRRIRWGHHAMSKGVPNAAPP